MGEKTECVLIQGEKENGEDLLSLPWLAFLCRIKRRWGEVCNPAAGLLFLRKKGTVTESQEPSYE